MRHFWKNQHAFRGGRKRRPWLWGGGIRSPTWSLSATLPDGRTVALGNAPVTDHMGIMGLTGDVDHHFWRNLTVVLIAGTLRGGAQVV